MLLKEDSKQKFRFLIKPNRSLTAKGMILFVVLVGIAIFLVALRFVLLGAWLVLPFAFLEIVMLAAGFWLYERASRYSETVEINGNKLLITKSSIQSVTKWELNPHWVRFVLKKDPKEWYPSKLLICSHSDRVEIGACLIDAEREELLDALRDAMPNVLQHSV